MARRRTTPTPGTRRRGIAIVRVSKENGRGDKLVSPDIQRASITDHCARHSIDIVAWVEAIDESGSRAKSAWWPRLDAQIERVEVGEADVIVAWEFSRHARNRLRWAVALDRVEAAGGSLESATEPVDVTTAAGRFQRGVLAEMHAYKAEAIGEGWQQVQASRVRRGLPPGGKLPWGWRWEHGAVAPDPEKAPVIVEAYDRFLAGAGIRDLTRWLNGLGVRPMHRDTWHNATITQCLDSPIHAGLITYQGDVHPGAHDGVVDVTTWEQYRRERRRRAGERQVKRRYLLSGIATCGTCGAPMRGFTMDPDGRERAGRTRKPWSSYRCTSEGRTADEHGQWNIALHVVDTAVLAWLRGVAADVGNRAPRAAARRDTAAAEAARIGREIGALDGQLTTLTGHLASGLVPEGAYVAARDDILARRTELERGHAEAERLALHVPDDPSRIARDALEDWDEWPVEGCRAVLRQLVQAVVVDYERRTARVVPVWEPMPHDA